LMNSWSQLQQSLKRGSTLKIRRRNRRFLARTHQRINSLRWN
jgi:hypothetical protein